tara:strand:+ start:431 stop:931 length:501 start_codon:yes stop_codon:yes gene_type:complete
MYIDRAFLIKQSTNIIMLCIRCITKCEVIIGKPSCDDTYDKRILPDKTFIANSTLDVHDIAIAHTLIYQTHEKTMLLSDIMKQDWTTTQYSEDINLWLSVLLCSAFIWQVLYHKYTRNCTYTLHNSAQVEQHKHKKKKTKKKKKIILDCIKNPITWGLYSTQYSEC